MNRLYFLPIAGHGTEDIESLSSYLMRLANLHVTSVPVLLEHLQPRSFRTLTSLGASDGLAACIRPKSISFDLLVALAEAVGVEVAELEPTTFAAFENSSASLANVCSPNPRWCPTCFRNQAKGGQPVYLKLVWQLLQAATCHVHNVRLRDRCDKCGQFPYRRRRIQFPLDKCGSCLRNITEASPSDLCSAQPMDSQLVDLVGHIARNPGIRFPARGVSTVMSKLIDEATETRTEKGMYRFIRREDCMHFAEATTPVSLIAALQIAFRLRIPLLALLEGNLTGTTRSLLCLHDGRREALLEPIDRHCEKRERPSRALDSPSQPTLSTAEHQALINRALAKTQLGVLRVYFRVSAATHSLLRQHTIVNSARERGWFVAGIYRETATGERETRPELSRLIKDLMPGDAVIVETTSSLRALRFHEADRLVYALQENDARLAIPGVIELSDLVGSNDEETLSVRDELQKFIRRCLLQLCETSSPPRKRRPKETGLTESHGDIQDSGQKVEPLRERVVELRKAGNSINKAARLARCSTSYVKRIWAAHGASGDQ